MKLVNKLIEIEKVLTRIASNPKATVQYFLTVLGGALTRMDERESQKEMKRRISPNIYRLSLLLKAKQEVEKEVQKYLDDDSEEAMNALKVAMSNHFFVDSSPELRKFMKQIDAWVSEKKTPKYAAKKMTEEDFDRKYTLDTSVKSEVFDDGGRLETYGDDLEKATKIHKSSPMRIWTMIEEDGVMALVLGMRTVNRIYYLVTKEKAKSKNEEYIFD